MLGVLAIPPIYQIAQNPGDIKWISQVGVVFRFEYITMFSECWIYQQKAQSEPSAGIMSISSIYRKCLHTKFIS